jgi:hypothetical protein
MTKKILNLHEETTRNRLRAACEKWGASVFVKVRVADVLEIERSGISGDDYRFALQSHFDFVVADQEHVPLFAVEFDGPSHKTDSQKNRDAKKARLCHHLEFPLLRINARYLIKKYGRTDLLSWFVDVWFLAREFYEAKEAGSTPPDEFFDPLSIVSMQEHSTTFPLWLSRKSLLKIHQLAESGRILDPAPFDFIGLDQNDTYRGLAYLRVTKYNGVYVTTGMQNQFFLSAIGEIGAKIEIVEELLIQELYEALVRVLNGEDEAVPLDEIDTLLKNYQEKYRLVCCTSRGPSEESSSQRKV